jgi:DNA-binding response OmpR family regulator
MITAMPAVQPQPARVLVVDDEARISRAMRRALQLSGFEVTAVSSGEEALATLAAAPYDVMLLDLRMPGMQGEEVMQRVHERWPELLIVILTGHATLESAITAIKSSAVDYLLKPCSLHEVVAAVRHALGKKAEQRRQRQVVDTIHQLIEALQESEAKPPAPPTAQELPEGTLQVHPLTLHRERRLVVVEVGDGLATVELSESEALILACLMAQPGQVLSCQQLARETWQYEVEEKKAQALVRPVIARLRSKMQLCAPGLSCVHNVRGRGYFLQV